MGYTHYYTIKEKLTQEEIDKIANDFEIIRLKAADNNINILTADGSNEYTYPDAEGDFSFNGDGHQGQACESFWLSSDAEGFCFCKTKYRNYDLAVIATFQLINFYAPGKVTFSSDGDKDDWLYGMRFYHECFPDREAIYLPE